MYLGTWILESLDCLKPAYTVAKMQRDNQNLRCVNCSIRMNRPMRPTPVEDLDDALQRVFHSWFMNIVILVPRVLCIQCVHLLQIAIGSNYFQRVLGHQNICFPCGISLRRIKTHTVNIDCREREILQSWIPSHQNFNIQSVCIPCWLRATRQARQIRGVERENVVDIVNEDAPIIPPPPPLPINVIHEQAVVREPRTSSMIYKRAPSNSIHCCFRNCHQPERRLIPSAIKEILLMHYKLYIPRSARICNFHLQEQDWATLKDNCNLNDFSASQNDDIFTMLSNIASRPLDFNNIRNMPAELCLYWFGLNADQFYELLSYEPELPPIYLAAYLCKLRTGDGNERLASIFKVSESTFRNYLNIARTNLLSCFVHLHLGFGHTSATAFAARNNLIPNGLFGSPQLPIEQWPIICVCDGTYAYIQKSSNYRAQKRSYSLHKFRNLVKPFLLVATDGYILQCSGPYPAIDSDAKIMKSLFSENSEARNFFRPGDIFILDRGFRDCIQFLTDLGYQAYIPETLHPGEFQLTWDQANMTRFITLVRWVVEVINGRYKRDFRLLRFDYNNRASPHLMDDYKIASALLNKFHLLITDPSDAAEILRLALLYRFTPNYLGTYILENNINRMRTIFTEVTDLNINFNFPRLSFSDLRKVCLGIYQIKQARSYFGEHMKENGRWKIELCTELHNPNIHPTLAGDNVLLRGRVRSRHVSGKKYFTYILVSNDPNIFNSRDAIKAYYCTCRVGMRTVGCCAHIMSIIWYLGWARHERDIEIPAEFMDHIFLEIDDEHDEEI